MAQSKVALVQRLCPHYRKPLFRLLGSQPSLRLTVLTSEPDTQPGSSTEGFDRINFATSRLKFYWGAKKYLVPFSPSLLQHVWRSDYDIVIAEGVTNLINNIFLYPICRLKGIKFICWDAGRRRNAPRTIWRKLADPFFNWLVRGSDACLVYSNMAADYLKQVGASPTKIFVAHNTIDVSSILQESMMPDARGVQLKQKLGIEDHRVVLFVGVVERRKKIEHLIEAFQHVRKSVNFPVALLIIGDGDHLTALKQWTSESGMEKNVQFLGRIIDGVGDYFKLCDVFVLPSEGGLAINQAMAYGKPIIASSADGTEEDLITIGWNGFLLEEDNVQLLVSKIQEILVNQSLATMMGANSRKRIQEKFTLPQMVESFVKAVHFVKQS